MTVRDLLVEAHGDGRRITLSHPYARGWLEVNENGVITAYEIDTTYVPARETKPAGLTAAATNAIAKGHALWIKGTDAAAKALSGDEAGYERVLALCRSAGSDGGVCELLGDTDGVPWCGHCKCGIRPKYVAGMLTACPAGKWHL